MMAALVGLFLILHGMVHLVVFVPEPGPNVPWVPIRPFVPGMTHQPQRVRRLAAVAFAVLTMVVYVVAGMAIITGAAWWTPAAVLAAAASVVLLVGNYHPVLVSGLLLDVTVLVLAATF